MPVTALRLFNSGGKKVVTRFDIRARHLAVQSAGPDHTQLRILISNPVQTIFPSQTANFSGKRLLRANGYASPVALTCAPDTTAAPTTCTPNPATVTPSRRRNVVYGERSRNCSGLFQRARHRGQMRLRLCTMRPSPYMLWTSRWERLHRTGVSV